MWQQIDAKDAGREPGGAVPHSGCAKLLRGTGSALIHAGDRVEGTEFTRPSHREHQDGRMVGRHEMLKEMREQEDRTTA